jgi:hypothetical protein
LLAPVAPVEQAATSVLERELVKAGAACELVDPFETFGDCLEQIELTLPGLRFAFDQVAGEVLDSRVHVQQPERAVDVAPPAIAHGQDVARPHADSDQLRDHAPSENRERVAAHSVPHLGQRARVFDLALQNRPVAESVGIAAAVGGVAPIEPLDAGHRVSSENVALDGVAADDAQDLQRLVSGCLGHLAGALVSAREGLGGSEFLLQLVDQQRRAFELGERDAATWGSRSFKPRL